MELSAKFPAGTSATVRRARHRRADDSVYICTTDAAGNACSLIQSIYYGFGSAFVAGDTGVLLHNRAHYFSLDADHPNRLEPGKRTLHTLMVCMAVEYGRPRFVLGTMGADGQPQTNVQVLLALLAGAHPQHAVAAPRVLHGRFLLEDDPDMLHVEADLDPPHSRRWSPTWQSSTSCRHAANDSGTPTRSPSSPTARCSPARTREATAPPS